MTASAATHAPPTEQIAITAAETPPPPSSLLGSLGSASSGRWEASWSSAWVSRLGGDGVEVL
eukprot:CAMPEP_0196747326 /NCGR_PEP_ID=MMETSP1091-20130531/69244_1 /TAXON_ID=302021 /ORGANISM="Rhodomonas sp., Strain CCMP768" /LENGTH=61 /DNA_ID=CAMNT_0042094447 /DNA_START=411 /DNA_END=592 /DNA_ORIENTATION=+